MHTASNTYFALIIFSFCFIELFIRLFAKEKQIPMNFILNSFHKQILKSHSKSMILGQDVVYLLLCV